MNIWKVLISGMNTDYKDIDINNLTETWLYEIKSKDANFEQKGGDGAVRAFIEIILKIAKSVS